MIKKKKKEAKVKRKKLLIAISVICCVLALVTAIIVNKASYKANLFSIQVTDKGNDHYNSNEAYFLFKFEIENDSKHDATYLEGTMTIKDSNGNVLSSGDVWFSGDIKSKSTSYFDLSWRMNRNDNAVQMWNTDFSKLVITYRITEIHFEGGTIKEYTGEDVIVNK